MYPIPSLLWKNHIVSYLFYKVNDNDNGALLYLIQENEELQCFWEYK